MLKNVIVVGHPLVQDSLGHLRNRETVLSKFRHHSDKLCELLFAEALRGLEMKKEKIKTPLAEVMIERFDEKAVVIPIFRAGLAMLFGAMRYLNKSKVGFVGLERDEETAEADEYYWKVPDVEGSTVIVTDPMLATGGSMLHVLKRLSESNPKVIRIVCVVAAPEGIEAVISEFPEVVIYTAAVDDHLNDKAFIVPGLGDYGDRYFGTE